MTKMRDSVSLSQEKGEYLERNSAVNIYHGL